MRSPTTFLFEQATAHTIHVGATALRALALSKRSSAAFLRVALTPRTRRLPMQLGLAS